MPGLRKTDKAIMGALPCGYEARHIQDVYPKELFPLNNHGTPHYGESPWMLFIDGERHIPLAEVLAEVYQDGGDGKSLNRAKAMLARKANAKRPCGDFKTLAMLCSYLVHSGAINNMPKAVLDQQIAAANNGHQESEKQKVKRTNAGNHLLKLESSPSQVLPNWCSQALQYWGSKKEALKAFAMVFDALEESEKQFDDYKESVLNSARAAMPGIDTSDLEETLERDRKKRVAALTQNLQLPPAKLDNENHS